MNAKPDVVDLIRARQMTRAFVVTATITLGATIVWALAGTRSATPTASLLFTCWWIVPLYCFRSALVAARPSQRHSTIIHGCGAILLLILLTPAFLSLWGDDGPPARVLTIPALLMAAAMVSTWPTALKSAIAAAQLSHDAQLIRIANGEDPHER